MAVSLTKDQVLSCTFSRWYPLFRQFTIKSRVIALPPDFVTYLLSDGLVLPVGAQPEHDGDWSNGDSDAEDWQHDSAMPTAQAPQFPQLLEKIKAMIAELGGVVFPKLNWSAPQDACWISCDGTLRCRTPGDIIMLLKSSDFITHDLTCPFKDCKDGRQDEAAPGYELVLRRWVSISPGMEFRCFVRNGCLVAACQRDYSNFYSFLKENEDILKVELVRFFEKIHGIFPTSSYVYDVYRRAKDKFWIIDVNPFGVTTDSLLFSWSELDGSPAASENGDGAVRATPEQPFQFRIQDVRSGVQPSPYRSARVPRDVVDISSGEDINKFVDLFRTLKQQEADEPDLEN